MNGFNSNLLDGKTKLHFVGIGGSGMFPLVQILHAVGYEITGSDVGVGDIVDREKAMGIPVYHGHRARKCARRAACGVYSRHYEGQTRK